MSQRRVHGRCSGRTVRKSGAKGGSANRGDRLHAQAPSRRVVRYAFVGLYQALDAKRCLSMALKVPLRHELCCRSGNRFVNGHEADPCELGNEHHGYECSNSGSSDTDSISNDEVLTQNALRILNHFEALLHSASRPSSVSPHTEAEYLRGSKASTLSGAVKAWKLLLILARLDAIAEVLKSSCIVQFKVRINELESAVNVDEAGASAATATHDHADAAARVSPFPSSSLRSSPVLDGGMKCCFSSEELPSAAWTIADNVTATSEAECLRHLFMVSRPFRVLLGVLEWCEWVSRFRVGRSTEASRSAGVHPDTEPPPFSSSVDTGVGNLRYSDTVFRLSQVGAKPVASRMYHLDLPFTIAATAGSRSAGVYRGSGDASSVRRVLSEPVSYISPIDAMSSGRFFQTIWGYLTTGALAKIRPFSCSVGEPWIETLLAGQIPPQDPSSFFSMLYDAALNSMPDAVSRLLDEERDLFVPENDDFSECMSSSWVHSVLFEPSSDIIRTHTEKNEAEEFDVGNPARSLFVEVSRAALLGTSRNTLCVYEKAFYGFLSGSTDAMLPATETWEERLWVHCIELQERLVGGLRDTLIPSDDTTQRTTGYAVDKPSLPFATASGERKRRSLLDLTDEFEHIFHAAESCAAPGSEERCVWRPILQQLILVFLKPSSFVCGFIRLTDDLCRPSDPKAKLAEYQSVSREAADEFLTRFVILYKQSIADELPDGRARQRWIDHCDEFLCEALLRYTESSDALAQGLSTPVALLSAMSKDVQRRAAARWLTHCLAAAPDGRPDVVLQSPICKRTVKILLDVTGSFPDVLRVLDAMVWAIWMSSCTSAFLEALSTAPAVVDTLDTLMLPAKDHVVYGGLRVLLSCYDQLLEIDAEDGTRYASFGAAGESDLHALRIGSALLEMLVPLLELYCYQDMVSFVQRDQDAAARGVGDPHDDQQITMVQPQSASAGLCLPPGVSREASPYLSAYHDHVPHRCPQSKAVPYEPTPEERYLAGTVEPGSIGHRALPVAPLSEAVTDRQLTRCIEILDDRVVRRTIAALCRSAAVRAPPSGVAENATKKTAASSKHTVPPSPPPALDPLSHDTVLAKLMLARTVEDCRPLVVREEQDCCWDSVALEARDPDAAVRLTSLVHYLSIRHLTEILLTLKDLRVLLLDSAFRAACRQPVKTQEIAELVARLVLATGGSMFVASPYKPTKEACVPPPNPPLAAFSGRLLLTPSHLRRLDQRVVHALVVAFLGVVATFLDILDTVWPRVVRSAKASGAQDDDFKLLSSSVLTLVRHLLTTVQSGPLECVASVQSVVVEKLTAMQHALELVQL